MRTLIQGACLALLGAGLAGVPAVTAPALGTTSAAPDGPVVQRLRAEAQGAVTVSADRASGRLGFARAARGGDLMPAQAGDSLPAAVDKATAYLDEYGAAFGAGRGQLHQSAARATGDGWTITFTQSYRGLPVFGSMLKANVDQAGDLTAVNGFAAPGLSLGARPRLSPAGAGRRAVGLVEADPPGGDHRVAPAGLRAASTDLVVYQLGAIRGSPGRAILAYVVEVTDERSVRDLVFIDALTGKAVNRYSLVHAALERELYEADEERNLTLVWEEGDPFPARLNTEQRNLVLGAGDTYWLFHNAFGRDSYDGKGAAMRTINNDPLIECPNASWNGETTNYCNGVTSDDTVAHEWTHAYTEHTSGLIYQWQAGALNESYSDIWGETVDMVNGRQDQGDDTTKRPDGLCSQYTRGEVGLTINSPAEIAGPCEAAAAEFGPVFDKTGITGDVVVGRDRKGAGGDTATNGCDPFTNAAEITDIVYVDRGLCTFQTKADHAAAAGARAIVVGNHTAGEPPFAMSADSDIYGVMIGLEDGERIKSATSPVNVTIKDIGSDTRVDSYRWLSGEGDPAFGGAIRDLWTPTCYGDPGRVSDAEYHCSENDAGGVHTNSGVPNHAFALLVDGGTYNDVTVPGIGLDKAAHIYWRAQTAYLTPTSGFEDLADALDASCTDTLGDPITAMSTKRDAPGATVAPVTPADCAAVTAASDAVELRREPAQCNFRPLLRKRAPGSCGKGFRSVPVFKEGFRDGLRGWKRSERVAYRLGRGYDWRTSANAPRHGDNRAAFGPGPDAGSCSLGRDDISSTNGLHSPRIVMPRRRFASSRLSFRHYLATESGFDGGNVRIKVNSGTWRRVPAGAFRFNAYNTVLEPASVGGEPYNTNPLAGQPAFSGTDGGSLFGSWGTSIIDLEKLGVGRGDLLRVRFDMGRDGCGGNDGWYVDNVKVVVCRPKQDSRVAVPRR